MCKCPHCGKEIDPYNVMGDSDWSDEGFDWVENECSCGKYYQIRQLDVEIVRSFEIKGSE